MIEQKTTETQRKYGGDLEENHRDTEAHREHEI